MDPVRRRLKIGIVALAVALLLGLDMARPPRDQISARCLLAAIHLYQATLSPRLGSLGVRCRFTPTCSHYGEGAIRKYGAWTGSWKTAWRIARCGPWTPAGTVDPP
ncbi:MAG TPA: membrane protein insertion efficiency factor YidD [Thermoanaerobaculia bacterium]